MVINLLIVSLAEMILVMEDDFFYYLKERKWDFGSLFLLLRLICLQFSMKKIYFEFLEYFCVSNLEWCLRPYFYSNLWYWQLFRKVYLVESLILSSLFIVRDLLYTAYLLTRYDTEGPRSIGDLKQYKIYVTLYIYIFIIYYYIL